jgi:hypothetical protein
MSLEERAEQARGNRIRDALPRKCHRIVRTEFDRLLP